MREWFSYDTIANGYFSFFNFSKIRNWGNILVITSDFHLERTKLIFNWIYFMDKSKQYNIDFIGVSDEGLDDNIIKVRREREKNSVDNLNKLIKKVTNFDELHRWFHNEHNCYNCNFSERSQIKCKIARASY